jgi:PD-(D/E)XK nuclease superfamily
MTYLKLTGSPVGLLLNFKVPVMVRGIKRKMNPDAGANVAGSSPKK